MVWFKTRLQNPGGISSALLCMEVVALLIAFPSATPGVGAEMASRCSKWHKTRYLTLGCEFGNRISVDGAFYGFSARERNCFYQAGDCTENTTISQCNGVSSCTVAVARSNFGFLTCGFQAHDYIQVHYRCVPDSFFGITSTSGPTEVDASTSVSTLRPPTISWIVPTIVIETNPTTRTPPARTTRARAKFDVEARARHHHVDQVHHDKQENNLTSPNSIAKEAEAEAHVADKRHKGEARSAVSLFLILAILLGVALFILLLMLIVIIVFKHRFKEVPYDDLPVKTSATTSFVPHSVYVYEKKSLETLAAENVAALRAISGSRSESQKELVLDMMIECDKNSDQDEKKLEGDVEAPNNPRYERQPSSMTSSALMNASMTNSMMAKNDEEHIYEALELDHYENCAAAKLRTQVSVPGTATGADHADEPPPLPPLPPSLPEAEDSTKTKDSL